MESDGKRAPYVSFWVFALAFGWIEAAVVVYLRAYASDADGLSGSRFPVISLPTHLVAIEVIREACTILVLGAVAWLAGRRWASRVGAFLLMFGVWDLAYYAGLRLASGWPDSLTTWDILFLIPLPWIAPVWAPATVAAVFVVAGSYLFWTAERPRRYSRKDLGAVLAAALLIIGAFLADWKVVVDLQGPPQFPAWLFWAGVLLGTSWFAHVERRLAAEASAASHWLNVHVRPDLEQDVDQLRPQPGISRPPEGSIFDQQQEAVIGHLLSEYTAARRRLGALRKEAVDVGERLEKLGHALSTHPTRMIIGTPSLVAEDRGVLEVVTSQPLPTIDALTRLTGEIRKTAQRVDELTERLILLGRGDVIEQPDGYFK